MNPGGLGAAGTAQASLSRADPVETRLPCEGESNIRNREPSHLGERPWVDRPSRSATSLPVDVDGASRPGDGGPHFGRCEDQAAPSGDVDVYSPLGVDSIVLLEAGPWSASSMERSQRWSSRSVPAHPSSADRLPEVGSGRRSAAGERVHPDLTGREPRLEICAAPRRFEILS